jgi:hypothetical protein
VEVDDDVELVELDVELEDVDDVLVGRVVVVTVLDEEVVGSAVVLVDVDEDVEVVVELVVEDEVVVEDEDVVEVDVEDVVEVELVDEDDEVVVEDDVDDVVVVVVVVGSELLVDDEVTGVQTHASSRSSAVHSSPSGQLPRQTGNTPPHATSVVVVLLVVVGDVVVVGSVVDVEVVVGASVDVVDGGSVDVVVDVDGMSVVEVDVLVEVDVVVVGTSVVELVDEVVGASVVVEVDEVVAASDVDELDDVELDELDDDVEVVVVLVLLEVVVLPNVPANPTISTMVFPPAVVLSHVLTKSESGWTGSNASPNGAAVKSLAKSSSVGVLAPPSGRPVPASMTTRQISLSTKLVNSRWPPYSPPGTYSRPVTPCPPTRGGPGRYSFANSERLSPAGTTKNPGVALVSSGTS